MHFVQSFLSALIVIEACKNNYFHKLVGSNQSQISFVVIPLKSEILSSETLLVSIVANTDADLFNGFLIMSRTGHNWTEPIGFFLNNMENDITTYKCRNKLSVSV